MRIIASVVALHRPMMTVVGKQIMYARKSSTDDHGYRHVELCSQNNLGLVGIIIIPPKTSFRIDADPIENAYALPAIGH